MLFLPFSDVIPNKIRFFWLRDSTYRASKRPWTWEGSQYGHRWGDGFLGLLRPSSVGQAFRALRRGALSWAQVQKNATIFGGQLGHGTICSLFFCLWDWDTPKSLCDIFQDDMYLKPSLIRVQHANHSSESIKNQTFITFLIFSFQESTVFAHGKYPTHHRAFWEGHESCRSSHLGSFLAAPTLLYLQPSHQNSCPKLTLTMIFLWAMGSFDVHICFVRCIFMKLFLRRSSIQGSHNPNC